MAAPTFLDTLRVEVARMQAMHPEREGELARAHALIAMGMVEPSPTDASTAKVLSSDGTTRYEVNGACTCPSGLHGKDCKHMHAWKLYQFIQRKVEAEAHRKFLMLTSKTRPSRSEGEFEFQGHGRQF